MARPNIEIVRAGTYKKGKVKLPCIVEEKLQGHRMVMKKGQAYGRAPDTIGVWRNKWAKLPVHIQRIAIDEWVDGELIWPNHDDSEIVTGLNEHPSEMEFIAFALPERYGDFYPDEHLIHLRNLGFKIPFFLYKNPGPRSMPYYFDIPEEEAHELVSDARKRNIEGYILKQRMKQPVWWKLKVTQTYDLVMTGYTIATAGKHKDRIKSIKGCVVTQDFKYEFERGLSIPALSLTPDMIEVANVSGMADEVRYAITDKDIGRVFEVEANLLAGKGRLRHPRFIRWRDDKSATECTYESEIGNQS